MEVEIELEAKREEIVRATQYTLVRKILVNKMLNKKGVMRVIRNIWTGKEGVAVRELEGNLYAISFGDKQSMEMTLEGEPWMIIGSCLNLKKWEVDQAV